MSDEKSSRSAITTIITFVLLNIIWTGALNATADQHLISPSSDIVTEYRFEGPDVFDREIPFKVMYEINEVEGREPSEVTIDLVFSDDSIVNIHNGGVQQIWVSGFSSSSRSLSIFSQRETKWRHIPRPL